MKRERRKIKLIHPGLQLRVAGAFAGVSVLSFVLLGLFIASRSSLPRDGGTDGAPNVWIEVLVLALGLFLPLTIAIGILLTHRIAGPIYRIESHLRAVLRGEDAGPCLLRKGDELTELCELVNQTVVHLRERTPEREIDAVERRKRFRAVS